MFYVYILESLISHDLYVGYSEDLKQRFSSHNQGNVKSTSPNRPWRLIYYESYRDKRDATKREKQLKNHKAKDDLKIQLENSLDR